MFEIIYLYGIIIIEMAKQNGFLPDILCTPIYLLQLNNMIAVND